VEKPLEYKVKTRTGFVSNSSTTNFHIYGVIFDDNDIDFKFNVNALIKLHSYETSNYKKCIENFQKKSNRSEKKYIPLLKKINKLTKEEYCILNNYFKNCRRFIKFAFDFDLYRAYGIIWVGRSWWAMKEEETLKEFKEKVIHITKILFNRSDCKFYQDVIEDDDEEYFNLITPIGE
jgi:hypothetical protein